MILSNKFRDVAGIIAFLALFFWAASPAAAADVGSEKWTFTGDGGGMFQGGAAISPNGTIYTGCSDGKLYAITPGGAKEWAFDTSSKIYNATPALAPNGTIYFGARNGYLYAVSPDGTQEWAYDAGSPIEASPAISSNGTILIVTTGGGFRAVYPDGSAWLAVNSGLASYRGSVAISSNGTWYYGSANGAVYARRSASLEWSLSTSKEIRGTIAISGNGTLYVPAGDQLWAVSKAGAKLWEYDVGGSIYGSPIISANGTIYVSDTTNRKIHAVNPDGTEQWTYTAPSALSSSPVLSSNGTIYFTVNSCPVCALSPAGELKWSCTSGDGAKGFPVIGPDGTVYAGTNNNHLVAVVGDGYGMSYSAWPYFRADIHGTGRVQQFWTLPDSGQTVCYNDEGAVIDCPASGVAFHGQDAQYNGSQPHFEVYEDNANGNITLDLNSNLMWQYKGDHTKHSLADAQTYCTALTLGGYTDWRLPLIWELINIVNFNSSNPACYSSFSCMTGTARYLSSTPYATSTSYAWTVNFYLPTTDIVNSNQYVRCVRGAKNAPSYFAANRSKIVKDATTGLVWQRDGDANGALAWVNALSACENLSLAGKTDWRLPNANELMTIVDFSNASLSVAPAFANMHASGYWSSTTWPAGKGKAVYLGLDLDSEDMFSSGKQTGRMYYEDKDVKFYSICVRNGSAGSPDRTAVISGSPSGTSAVFTVSGTGIAQYRYKLDSGNFSDVTSRLAPIRLNGLSTGAHTVSVLGISDEGKLQRNPTTKTWSASSSSEVKTNDGTNPNTDPDSADADTNITYPEYQETQYSGTVNTILTDMGYSAMGANLGNYSAWQDKVTDATALTYLKANDSTDIKKGINLLSTGGSVDRVLTGMVNASCTSLTNGYCLFVRNTTNLAKTYHRSNLRYAKIMGDTVTLVELAMTPFDSSVTSDIYVYLRKADGSVVTDSFTGEVSTCVWVKDDGVYDAISSTPGTVADPGFVTSLASGSSSSSSTGCMMNPNAGFSLEWLLTLLTPAAVWLRWRK